MEHKLIIIDGPSTVGKSTVSKSVYKQISKHQKSYWLHEECIRHPIRHEEFKAGDLTSHEGMALNRKSMFEKWQDFRDAIEEKNQVCITEGCLLHAYDRYFVRSVWDEEQIQDYYKEVLQSIESLNPLIIFLHRPDLRLSFEKAFKARGDWWRDIICDNIPESHKYVKDHNKKDEDIVFGSLLFEQEQMEHIFDRLSCKKLKVDTSEEDWEHYVKSITEKAGYPYNEEKARTDNLAQYCGTYRLQDGEKIWNIGMDKDNNCLFTSLFWPYMPMKCIDDDLFELISFPAEMAFQNLNDELSFTVSGNYDWGYNNQTFIKIGDA